MPNRRAINNPSARNAKVGRPAMPKNSLMGSFDRALNHWTPAEQTLLKEFNIEDASGGVVKRCAKVVLMLPNKTLDDVALRCRWMAEKAAHQQVKPSSHATNGSNGLHRAQLSTSSGSDLSASKKKENGKGMKDNSNSSMRNNGKKVKAAYKKVTPSAHAINQFIDYDDDNDDELSYKGGVASIGGAAAQLLEQNEQALNQMTANINAFKLHENSYLGSQMLNNVGALLYESVYDTPEIKQSGRKFFDFPIIRR